MNKNEIAPELNNETINQFPTNNGKLIDVKRVKDIEKTEEKWYSKNNLTIKGKIVWKIKSRFLRINKFARRGMQTKKSGILPL